MAAGTGNPRKLTAADLQPGSLLEGIEFETTRDIEPARRQLGGERAMSALRLGIDMRQPGYNVFVAGLEGTDRQEQLRHLIAREAEGMPPPSDIVYVNNFDDPDRPLALMLPTGDGRRLRREMDELVANLRRQIPEALKKESFEKEREQITSAADARLKELFKVFQESAREKGIFFRMSPEGQMVFIPLKDDGEPVANQEEYDGMPEERRKMLEKNREEVQREAREFAKEQQAISKKVREEVEGAVRKFVAELIAPLVDEIAEKFDRREVKAYLEKVRQSVIENIEDFRQEEEQSHPPLPFMLPQVPPTEKFLPYQVNVLVDNGGREGAPVIVQDSPTYQNLFGSVERVVDQTGKLVTNFTRIKAGDLHRANGGFLVFDLDDALTEIFVWKALKRFLKCGRLEIESQNPFAFFSVSGLAPEPIGVNTGLVVTGSRYAYSLLTALDPDFRGTFKMLADFSPEEKRGREAEMAYVERVAHLAAEEGLRHFSRDGVAELLRHGIRNSSDRRKISARLEQLDDLAREANLVAAENGREVAGADEVREALERRDFRANWMEERGRELINDGTLILELEGTRVGQVNGLTVMFFGGYVFGRPARLTASVSMGSAGIVNIEREAKLSGKIHDKGVLIIGGWMRNLFGRDKPLSFTASLAFEQSYAGIDGDSATAAEVFALLSRIANVPLRQDLAVTGSMNQQGEIQAIGGINEKIEGFFRTCRDGGLTGTQGVVMPAANVESLSLHPEVVAAVDRGEFHIYPIARIEEGIELFTGMSAGSPGEEGTVLDDVDKALYDMAKALKDFGRNDKNGNGSDKAENEENGGEEPGPGKEK
jgi:ATP-dependent Lon protease